MNPILYIVSLFYHWFNTRESSKDVAYEISIIAFSVIALCNVLTLLIIINTMGSFNMEKLDFFLKNFSNQNKEYQYLVASLCLISTGILTIIIAPRKKTKSINYDLRNDTVNFVLFFIYIFVSIIGFVISVDIPDQ